MRRARTILAAAIVAPIALATPAGAKPWHEREPVIVVSISGPGLDGPVLLNGGAAWRVLSLSSLPRGYGLAAAEPPSDQRLGPALRASYRFVQPGGRVQTLEQTLHPCVGDGRVWSFTPPRQDRVRLRTWSLVQSGWWHSAILDTEVPALLDACSRSESVAGRISGGAGPLTGAWVALGGVIALLAMASIERASRRRRQPARI